MKEYINPKIPNIFVKILSESTLTIIKPAVNKATNQVCIKYNRLNKFIDENANK